MSDINGNAGANGMMMGFLFGAVVGAGVALLMAPAAGSDTRRHLKEKAEALRDKAAGLKDTVHAKLDDVGHTVRDAAHDLSAAMKEGRDAFQGARQGGTTRT